MGGGSGERGLQRQWQWPTFALHCAGTTHHLPAAAGAPAGGHSDQGGPARPCQSAVSRPWQLSGRALSRRPTAVQRLSRCACWLHPVLVPLYGKLLRHPTNNVSCPVAYLSKSNVTALGSALEEKDVPLFDRSRWPPREAACGHCANPDDLMFCCGVCVFEHRT